MSTALQSAQRTQNGYNEVALADPKIWVRRTPKGTITQVKAHIYLREAFKEFCVIQSNPMITYDGYAKLNQVTSLAVITPDSIKIPSDDGQYDSKPDKPITDPVQIKQVDLSAYDSMLAGGKSA